jgi:hypothetical protein
MKISLTETKGMLFKGKHIICFKTYLLNVVIGRFSHVTSSEAVLLRRLLCCNLINFSIKEYVGR